MMPDTISRTEGRVLLGTRHVTVPRCRLRAGLSLRPSCLLHQLQRGLSPFYHGHEHLPSLPKQADEVLALVVVVELALRTGLLRRAFDGITEPSAGGGMLGKSPPSGRDTLLGQQMV